MPTTPPVKTMHQPPVPGFSLEDIYYTLFRHKGKILLLSAVGIIAAIVLFLTTPPVYTSEAKLLIRYVMENKSMAPKLTDSQVTSPDRGENIINSEVEILTSRDLAIQVADAVGPEKILARAGGGTNRQAAVGMIRKGLKVDVPNKGNVILIQFSHPDPTITQPVLTELIDVYLKRHREIHEGIGVLDDFFSRQADQIRGKLAQTEEQLKKLRTEAKVVSLEDTKRAYMADMSRIQDLLLTSEAELAEHKAVLNDLQKRSGNVSTNDSAVEPLPAEISTRYQELCVQLDTFQKRRQDLLVQFTEEHPLAKQLQAQITAAETNKKKLEAENPRLTLLAPSPTRSSTNAFDFAAEVTRVNGLAAKVRVLSEQLDRSRADAIRVVEAEPGIMQLQRKRDGEESNYRYYSSALEQSRVDESLGTGKITNISIVQTPSPPLQDTKALYKPLVGVFFGGILGGLALAFLLDRVLDLSVKRASDVDRHGGLPLFLSIPDTEWKGGFHFPKLSRNGHRKALPNGKNGAPVPVDVPGEAPRPALVPVVARPALHPYYAALRDRVMTYFEVRNMTHKPKLVGITSCHRGAGVSTVAAGLADSLSETGDGNVLLVDMNVEPGAAHPVHGSRAGCGLSEALETDKPETAFVQEKLYLVSVHETKNSELPRILPKRFAHLIPRMKASDYDYIIFDMPPVNQTSVTPRLSAYMDMVLMVIESEKTGQEILQRVTGLLRESGASAAAVLNKNRRYVPARLSQEL